jgi:hypothetical protein
MKKRMSKYDKSGDDECLKLNLANNFTFNFYYENKNNNNIDELKANEKSFNMKSANDRALVEFYQRALIKLEVVI